MSNLIDMKTINYESHQLDILKNDVKPLVDKALTLDLNDENMENISDIFQDIKKVINPYTEIRYGKKYSRILVLFYRLEEFAGYLKYLTNPIEERIYKYIITPRLQMLVDKMDYPSFDWLKNIFDIEAWPYLHLHL